MGKKKKKTSLTPEGHKVVVKNKRAWRDYHIEETLEAGAVLLGSEVKSIRDGRISLTDAYAIIERGECWMVQCHIGEFPHAHGRNHEPKRKRKLLLNRREIDRLIAKIREKGLTLIVLSVYLKKGRVKIELGLAKGKRKYDKREAIKKKDEKRLAERGFER